MDKKQENERWNSFIDAVKRVHVNGQGVTKAYVPDVLYAANRIAELEEKNHQLQREVEELEKGLAMSEGMYRELQKELENERLRLAVCAAESDMSLIDQVVNLKKDVKFWKLECCNWQDLNTKIEEENRQLEDARRWVSVSEKLPPTGKTVMVFSQAWLLPCPATYLDRDYFLKEYDDPNYMESGFYPDVGFLFDLPETLIYPTHWQPFVEPLTTPPEESASPPDSAVRQSDGACF